jgi:hypothetical protein
MRHSTSPTGDPGGPGGPGDPAGPGGERQAPRRQAPRLRAWTLAATLAGIVLLAAACAGGSSAGGSTAHLTAYQKELAYAECMRSHGLPGFPDPQSDGTFQSTRENGSDFSGPAFMSADRACAHLEGPGMTPVQFQQNVRQLLKYAACMRAHGIANFQANVQGNRVEMGVQGPGSEMNTPQFLAAQRACRKLFPGGS